MAKQMSRSPLTTYGVLFACAAITACADFSDATEAVSSVTIQLLKPGEFADNSNLADRTVSLMAGGTTLSTTTDSNGAATFSGLTPQIYDITAAWSVSGAQYAQLTGGQKHALSDASTMTVSGSLTQQLITQQQTLELPLTVSEDQKIVIGKIYFATSKDNNNKYYEAGRYIELFNQAADTVDVSGLYIGLTEAESNQAYTLANLHDQHADSVVLLKQIFRIPSGSPYRVKPGGTVLLVNSAIDHTQMNTSLEPDLSKADFEAKDNRVRNGFTNNPDVPALELVYSYLPSISYLNMLNNGLCGIVIFRTDDDVTTWPLTYKYPNTATSGSQWKLLPKRLILDGVECLPNKNETGPDLSAKRLYTEIDASCTHINAVSGRTGEVVYRKTDGSTVPNGHKRLVDTNNSANDFQVSVGVKPGQYDDF